MKKSRKRLVIVATILCLISPFSAFASDNEVDEDTTITEEVKNVDQAGTYFVNISLNNELGQVMKKKIRVHVKYPRTQLNYELMEGIDANDIIVKTNTFKDMNESQLIKEGGAHAWSMVDGQQIYPLSAYKEEALKDTGTVGRVKFSTNKDTSLHVNVYEQDNIYLKLAQIYMTQQPVLTNKIRTMSMLLIALTIVPGFIFFILFKYISKKTKETQELLDK